MSEPAIKSRKLGAGVLPWAGGPESGGQPADELHPMLRHCLHQDDGLRQRLVDLGGLFFGFPEALGSALFLRLVADAFLADILGLFSRRAISP